MTLVHKPSAQEVGKTLLARRCSCLRELFRTFPGRWVFWRGNWLVSRPGKAGILQNRGEKISQNGNMLCGLFSGDDRECGMLSKKLETTVVARQVDVRDCCGITGWLLRGAENLIHFTPKITKLLLLLSVCHTAVIQTCSCQLARASKSQVEFA